MPTKKNFLGAQQNYNPKNGEYEPALVGKNGKPVEDADGDGISHESEKSYLHISKGHKLSEKELDKETKGMFKNREEANKWLEENKKELGEDGYKNAQSRIDRVFPKNKYDEIFDEDYQRSYGIPKFEDENDIKTLNDIVEKAMEYDGEEGAIDISNNAMERIEELVKFSPEEQDKLASGTGEEIMEILRSKESVSNQSKFSKFGKEKEFTGKDFLSEEHLDYLFDKFDGDENKVLDAVRADPEYQKSEITNSDLQGIVEVHTMKKSFNSINKKRMGA